MKKAVLIVILSTIFTSLAQLFLKFGADQLTTVFINWPLFFGVVFYALAALLIIISLKFGDMSVVFPAVAMNFVWVSLLSLFVLGETISIVNWAGVGSIVLGVTLLGRSA